MLKYLAVTASAIAILSGCFLMVAGTAGLLWADHRFEGTLRFTWWRISWAMITAGMGVMAAGMAGLTFLG